VGGARGCVEGAEVNDRAAGPTLGDGGSVLAVCGWGLRPTGSVGVSSGRVGGLGGRRRRRRAVRRSRRQRVAAAGHGQPRCSAASPSSVRRCWSGAAVVADPGAG
jgi:hypothetical protein